MKGASESGNNPLIICWYLGVGFYNMGVLYVSHNWSLLELLLIPAISAFAGATPRTRFPVPAHPSALAP
jgi:hypothetical protein